jgi:hypothetical protein
LHGQPAKAFAATVVTESGMMIVDRLTQSLKAASTMDVTELPMTTDVMRVQSWNTLSMGKVTESGITILVSLVQPAKAWLPRRVTESGITTDVRDVAWKALSMMDVTVSGMKTDRRFAQP